MKKIEPYLLDAILHIENRSLNLVRYKVLNQVSDHVFDHVGQVRSQVRFQVCNQVCYKAGKQVDMEIKK